MQRGQRDYFPQLQAAPGFIIFYLVADEANSINVAIIVWDSKAQADAFKAGNRGWLQTLEEMGHTLQSDNRGETVFSLASQRYRDSRS